MKKIITLLLLSFLLPALQASAFEKSENYSVSAEFNANLTVQTFFEYNENRSH